MRRITIGLAALGAALLAWVNGPLFDTNFDPNASLAEDWGYAWSATAAITPLFVAVVGGTLAAFRAMWLSTRRAELAAHIALGRTRAALVGQHVRMGLLDGLIAGVGGVTLAALVQQIRTGTDGVGFIPNTFLNYCTLVAFVFLSFVVAYWVAAVWATRGSVREVASGQRADAGAGSMPRGKRRLGRRAWLWVAGGIVVAASFAVGLGLWEVAPDENAGAFQSVVLLVMATVQVGVFYLAIPGVLVFAAARLAIWLAKTVSKAIARPAGSGSARSLVGDGLARPAPLRTVAVASVIAVMGVAVTVAAMVYGSNDTRNTAQDLFPHATVSAVDLLHTDEQVVDWAAGWSAPLPRDVVDALQADSALIVVEAGVLATDLRTVNDPYESTGTSVVRDLLIAVDPAALDAVSPSAGKRLYLVDGVLWRNGMLGWAGVSADPTEYIAVGDVRADVTAVDFDAPWVGLSRTWAENTWGSVPTGAVLLYPAGDLSVAAALDAHDLGDLSVVDMDATFGWESTATAGHAAAMTAPFLAVAVAIVIALAWSGQRLRARDQATLLALGAMPGALRGAAALESGVLTAVAGAVGLVGGAAIGPVIGTLSSAPLGAASVDVVLWNMGQDVAAIPWGVLIALVLGAAGIAAAGAALVRVRLDRLTPAQQLTEAHKAGIS